MFKVQWQESDFSSQEAEEMSGVSQNLQREWRRRGILPQQEGRKRVRYSLRDVCRLKILGILSASGISVKLQHMMAWQLAGHVAERMVQFREAAALEGGDLTNDEFDRMIAQVQGRLGAQYSLFRLPEPLDEKVAAASVGGTSLSDVEDMARKDGPVSAALIVEVMAIASEIVSRAPRPVVTYRMEGAD